ncbi:fungal specific transcription factor domain-containing protein [Aspergillus mulundensis]|uniref:Xylanolytic transcriptional activator regulatory domain-containing protein n=1 Tax=Aspergillus mulundensis TaxID=1810919 RepID=A0A3D8T7T5_9EURO|nr:Uncharacterized protein DSM5745_01380 [Aspergillus mulundensis]RDW94058.1 Uncharacterized protein DSM5745_01380 [Aspergillus mulundensis]
MLNSGLFEKRLTCDRRIEYLEARLARYENTTRAIRPGSQAGETLPEASLVTTPAPTRIRRTSVHPDNSAFLVDSLGLLSRASRPDLATSTNPESFELSPGSGSLHYVLIQRLLADTIAAIAADSSLSSSYTFGSRVQSLLDGPRPGQRQERAQDTANYLLQPRPRSIHVFDIPSLPDEREAFRLLETHVFYIGHTQNYIDAREISDKVGLFYANKDDSTYTESLWTLEILLIFAIARLLTGDFGGEAYRADSFPGYSLFEFVWERLPPLSQLYSVGRVGVEVLAQVAVYLQNIYRKEEAYVHVSTALRLAVSHGYHRQSSTARFLQSEATHINRLWWSIYHQERRLAAATGSPPGISDALIEQPLPTDSIGFTPAAPMRTSIKLARVYGQVMTVLYGSTPQAEDTFISNVQSIIRSLYDISDEIPMELATGMPRLGNDLSLRTSAALHLMFYQALLLTIRPVMLHIAQLILSGNPPQPGILYSSPIGKLCRTCTEAARRLLKTLTALRQNKCLALFGFFDFDGIFSVTFIMILTAILDSSCEDDQRIQPSPGLGEALGLIQYVADHENKFAARWFHEIQRTWAQLCSRLDMPESYRALTRKAPREAPDQTGDASQAAGSTNVSGQGRSTHQDDTSTRQYPGVDILNGDFEMTAPEPQSILADLDIWGDINHLWAPLPENYETFQNEESAAIPQSLYQNIYGNQRWAFTGEDMGDFAELGRHFVSDHPS